MDLWRDLGLAGLFGQATGADSAVATIDASQDLIGDLIANSEQSGHAMHFIPSVSQASLTGYLNYMQDGTNGYFDVASSLNLPRAPDTDSITAVSFEAYEDLLTDVNDRINAEPYISDEDNFGKEDLWSFVGNDCEDKVLGKYLALKEAGFPEDAMRIAVGFMPEGGHAVLAIRTFDRGDVLLDNYNAEIVPYDPDTTTGFRAVGVSSMENFMRIGELTPASIEDDMIAQIEGENKAMYAPLDDTLPEVSEESVPLPRKRPDPSGLDM